MKEVVEERHFHGGLSIRSNYHSFRVREWVRDEMLEWLLNSGYYECGMSYCNDDELRQEVLLQKAAMGE